MLIIKGDGDKWRKYGDIDDDKEVIFFKGAYYVSHCGTEQLKCCLIENIAMKFSSIGHVWQLIVPPPTIRFGIDDVSLHEALTPSPKAARAPQPVPRTPRQQPDQPLRAAAKKQPPKTPELHMVTEDPEMIRDALVSPKKDWQIVKSHETPDGKFKIKFGKNKKSEKSSPAPHFTSRISRRMCMEIGISAAELTQAMTRSPSPKKKVYCSQPVTSRFDNYFSVP